MSSDVFVSYPHEDQAIADAVCTALEGRGLKCWKAPRDIPPGTEWAEAIVNAIDNCRAVVLIFSAYTNSSKQISREVQIAFDKSIPVVPFRIENVVPTGSLAFYLGSVHGLDAWTRPIEPHLQRLADSVNTIVRMRRVGDKRTNDRKRGKSPATSVN